MTRETIEFESLVDRFYEALYRFGMTLCGNEADASDLTQQTFYIWAKRGDSLRDPGKVKSWLFTTMHREFLQRRRKLVRFPHEEIGQAEGDLPAVPAPGWETLDQPTVLAALQRLDPVFQGPIALFYLEDYSQKEIAAILDLPLGTVKSRLSRGLAQLQQGLTERLHRSKFEKAPL